MEVFIFKLGRQLGGRKEVTSTPVEELLYFLEVSLQEEEREVEREKARVFLNYLANLYSHPPQGKEDPKFKQARQEFVEGIKPSLPEPQRGPAKVYDWDEELMKRLRDKQQKGG